MDEIAEFERGVDEGYMMVAEQVRARRVPVTVGNGDIQAINGDDCAGCGRWIPAHGYIDNVTGIMWCAGCGDPRNTAGH